MFYTRVPFAFPGSGVEHMDSKTWSDVDDRKVVAKGLVNLVDSDPRNTYRSPRLPLSIAKSSPPDELAGDAR